MTPLFLEVYKINSNVCDSLVELWKTSDNKGPGMTHFGIELDVKDSIDLSFAVELGDIPAPQIWDYIDELQGCIDNYSRSYPYCINPAISLVFEAINIQYYPPGGGFKIFHNERPSGQYGARHLVFMTYLNTIVEDDEYQGGTEWLHQKFKLNAVKGNTVVWPADWTFTHRGIIAPLKEKFIITGWLNYAE